MSIFNLGWPRWIPWTITLAPIVAFVLFLGWCNSHMDEVKREWDAQKAKEAEERRLASEQARQADEGRAAETARTKREAAARDARERGLTPEERTALIGSSLPDVCEARRLLGRAPDPKAATLLRARSLIATAETKQLRDERPDFEKTRGIVCVDGDSSSCSCAGRHQGCCSHHRGIAGCTPYPTAVLCSN